MAVVLLPEACLEDQTLNATLRLVHYMENNQSFPSMEDLLPNLDAERQQHRLAREALDAEGEIAPGWRSSFEENTSS